MQEQNNGFQYTYSVKEQEELKRIRDKYAPRQESKLERLRRLDEGVTKKAQAAAIIFGVLGALILGFGMSLFMSDLGAKMGMTADMGMVIGIIVGVIGGLLVGVAYPVYLLVIKHEREKIAPEILRLTEELMK